MREFYALHKVKYRLACKAMIGPWAPPTHSKKKPHKYSQRQKGCNRFLLHPLAGKLTTCNYAFRNNRGFNV